MNRRDFISSVGVAGSAYWLSGASTFAQSHPNATPPKIKIGQIGTGHAHASGKMETLRSLPETYEIVGVAEPDPKRRAVAEKSKTYEGIPWLTEEQLLNTKGLTAVVVETEVCDLLSTAQRAIAAGKHIHLDKPAGESLSQFKQLLAEAARQKLTVQMGYMLRYNPAFQLCQRAVKEGWLGEVFSIDAAMSKVLDTPTRKALMKYPGGAMFELGCHVIDATVRVLGRPHKVTAYNRSSSPLNDGFFDNQMAVLEYPKATAIIRSAVIEIDGGSRRQFAVCGDQGTVDIRPIEPAKLRLSLEQAHGEFKKGSQEVTLPKSRGRYDGDFIDLAQVIRGEKAFEFTHEHDLAVQETVLLASGRPLN